MRNLVFVAAFGMLSAVVAASDIDFGPGFHEAGVIAPRSGQTVNVDAGAVVHGVIVVSNASDVVVRGKGTIVGNPDAGASIVVADSSRIRIDGVTLMRSLSVRADKASVSGVKASNIVFRPPVRDSDIIARKDNPCLVNVSVSGCSDVACENLSFSDFRLIGGPSRCYSRVEAAVGGRPIRRVSFRNMPEGMELYKAGAVETDTPSHVFGNGYRKFLLFGWEMGCGITPELLEKKAADFRASGIDGVGIHGVARYAVMHGPELRKDDFRSCVAGYRKALSLPGLRHSFLGPIFRAPSNRIDWVDSAAWNRIGKSMAALAWFARETGMKGCIIDNEDYKQQKQFVRTPGDPEYGKLADLVRRRAQELFAGVFREYPDIAIISFWLLSIDPDYFRSASALTVAGNKGDLWPHFVNGILDVMPPGARLIDGNEEGYRFVARRGDFNLSSVQQRDHVIELIAPENRVKFCSQVKVGFGLYVDAYENAEVDKNGKKRTGLYYRGPAGGSRTGGFALHAAEAAYAANEYVWLWNEKRPWVDWEKQMPKALSTDMTRVQKLKGVGDVLRAIGDSETYAFRRVAELKAGGQFVELLHNGECKIDSPAQGGGFVFANDSSKLGGVCELWVSRKSEASRFGVDTSLGDGDAFSVRAESAKGSFLYSVKDVKFGEYYSISASLKGHAYLRCAWKRKGSFDWTLPHHAIPFKEASGGWCRALGAVGVPENCDEMVLILAFDLADGEPVWFDNVSAAKIFTIPKDE